MWLQTQSQTHTQTDKASTVWAATMGWQYLLLNLVLPLFTAEDTFFEGDLLFQDTVLDQQSPELFVRGAGFKWPGGVVTYVFEANSR